MPLRGVEWPQEGSWPVVDDGKQRELEDVSVNCGASKLV